ncbi:MAG: type II/IV secretion system protein [Elusimicrobia bacterium]|nr:type II/IV secretion system protein [Elusimicrobiota bacterium]
MPLKYRFLDEWLLRAVLGLKGVTPEAVERFRQKNEPYLGQALIRAGLATQEEVAAIVRKAHGVSYCDLQIEMIDKMAQSLVPERLCRKHHLLPVTCDDETITVAMADPTDQAALDDVQAISSRRPVPCYCLAERVDKLIESLYSAETVIFDLLERLDVHEHVEVVGGSAQESKVEERVQLPVIRLADAIIAKAVAMRSSDIHIEHDEAESHVRYRIDGMLKHVMVLPRHIAVGALVSRIKIMADLDISQHQRPQDGRAKLRVGAHEVGLRVSILPTSFGEKVVMRIIENRAAEVPFQKLGFEPTVASRMETALKTAQGIFLVTGPTGSGKTTTLYALINKLKSEDTNIVTVEDPIEYRLEGINQVQVREKQGLGFAAVLRSVLRQDPDIILVGEVRDRETADIALQAALTGHLVLSTLHTNDTVSSIGRLADMGVERFKIASGLIAISAQRLVRRLCPDCKAPVKASESDPALVKAFARQGMKTAYHKPVGCPKCDFNGFKGRLALLEFLEITPELKERISAGDGETALRAHALERRLLHTMLADALWHLSQGDTTLEEVLPYVRLDPGADAAARKEASVPAPPAAQSPAQPKEKAAGNRVLVADDDKVSRSILRKVLQDKGYAVEEAEDGIQALAKIAQNPPDLLILDLNMPNMDGHGVIRALRQSLGMLGLPIIILTCIADEGSQAESLSLGADDYIVKPIKPPLVLARIDAAFRRLRLA